MEWVETTGKDVQEATEIALQQLGVLEGEADLEVLEEPRQGMFGRVRGSARVRARVRPTAPPPKQDKRRRSKKSTNGKSNAQGGSRGSNDGRGGGQAKGRGSSGADDGADRSHAAAGGGSTSSGASTGSGARRPRRQERDPMPADEQRSVGEDFLKGQLDAFGYEADVSSSLDDDGILLFEIDGEGLGLLIGPGLNTLDALQEVCRNAIQRQADGREYGKVVVDVAGVRADRATALEEFVRSEAQAVLDGGDDVVFEVMSRSDRKIVHDVVGDLEGLGTESIGEDPRRRVVLKRG
ncbi:MAG: protein jag [Microthrixaceae bacterium]